MQAPDLTHQFWNFVQQLFTINPQEPLQAAAKVAAIIGASVTVAVTLISKTYPWLRAKIESRSVARIFGEDLFPPKSIEKAIRYYIPPFCQSIDPAGGEESRLIHSVQAPLFETFDKALSSESEEKYHILLADSGMGKTSAVTNYCVRHQRRWSKKYHVAMVPLGIPDADERIKKIENKSKTSLFLDALDEDTLAMVDHVERLRLLIGDTLEFRKVIITSRTQFFSNDEEIPRETGVLKITVRSAGESAEQVFYKIYLAPFSDGQVKAYLKRRYPIWQRKRRRQAFDMVAKIPLLTARPMLLAHIDDLVKSDRSFDFTYELYEEMVKAWIEREKGFIENSRSYYDRSDQGLRDFSERLAADLYLNRARRGAERIPKDELNELAKEWKTPISYHKLSGRSLLNRDADGNFKFAHRSIMEYLFVQRFLENDPLCLTVEWTDQMNSFLWESLQMQLKTIRRGPRLLWLPALAENQRMDVLRRVLTFAVASLPNSSYVATETFLALCASILSQVGARKVSLSLWNSTAESYYPNGNGTNDSFYGLRLTRGPSYFGWELHQSILSTIERIVLPDRVVVVPHYSVLCRPNKTSDMTVVADYGLTHHKDGKVMVVPIFLGGSPSFVLTAESEFWFGEKEMKLFSEMFTTSHRSSLLRG